MELVAEAVMQAETEAVAKICDGGGRRIEKGKCLRRIKSCERKLRK